MATSTDLRAAIEEVQQQLPAGQLQAEGELIQEDGGDWSSRLSRRVGALPWWVISAATHAVLFLLIALLATAVAPVKQDEVVISTDVVKQKPPEYDPNKKRDIFKNVKDIQADTQVEAPVVVHEKMIESDTVETDNNMDKQTARGNEDAISDIPLGGTGTVGSIGVGGGGMAGCFGYRDGGSRKKAVGRFGGSTATESAVEAALQWLARHQEKNGCWKITGGAAGRENLGITGLATLAFLGAGYTHKSGKFADNVDRALKYIVGKQADDGKLMGDGTHRGYIGYNHAMAGLALVEAYGMTNDAALQKAAQKAVDYSKSHQDPYKGWRYNPKDAGDISVTGWFVMQLKSAKIAGLKVDGGCFQGGMNFVDSVSNKETGQVGYTGPVNGHGGPRPQAGGIYRREAIGLVCRQFMGAGRDDEMVRKAAAWPSGAAPTWESCDFYYWYYATLGMFQMGGEDWSKWNKALKPTLVDNQRKGGPLDGSENDVDGSWDTDKDRYGKECGRVYTTALGALCMEVYYRYLPMYTK